MRRERSYLPDTGKPDPVGPLECALAAEAPSGKIPCAAIFRIAAAHAVPVAEAGRAVQRLQIKVTGCQVGCF